MEPAWNRRAVDHRPAVALVAEARADHDALRTAQTANLCPGTA